MITGFDSTIEPNQIFKNLPGFIENVVKFYSKLSTDQIFHMKINDFEPKILFQKCNDQNIRQILPEVVNYIYPNKIEGIYPF